MTDDEWTRLLADLHAIETDDDVERAVEASLRLAELDDPVRLPDLKALIEDADFFVLEAIATPLAQMEGLSALPLLLRCLDRARQQGHDCDGLSFDIVGVVEREPGDAAAILLDMLRSDRDEARAHAAWLLGFVAASIEPDPLLAALDDPSPDVRGNAAGSLGSFPHRDDLLRSLAGLLRDPDEKVRIDVADALGYYGDRSAIPALEAASDDPSPRVREFARGSVERLSGEGR